MSKEIERKWLLESLPMDVSEAAEDILSITQAYLKVTEAGEIRIRTARNIAADIRMNYLTVKSKGGLTRNEVEEHISEEMFRTLFSLAEGKPIIKTRYRYDAGGGITMEFDLFEGHLLGLVLLEIEFPLEDVATGYSLPTFIQEYVVAEVTENKRFKNASLAFADSPPPLP